MEQILKLFIVSVLLLLYSCSLSESFSGQSADTYLYETYAPVKETLLFQENKRCIYTFYDVLEKKEISDTFFWRLTKDNAIVIYNEVNESDSVLKCKDDSAEFAQFNFTYEICPKWYSIKKYEFQRHTAYRYPIYQDRSVSLPLGILPKERDQMLRGLHPSFADKFGRYRIVCDTIVNLDSFLIWQKKLRYPVFLFAKNRQLPKKMDVPNYIKKSAYSLPSSSYEFLNYHINYGNSSVISQDSITEKRFSFIEDSYKKESIRFVNDSICTHFLFSRVDVSSPYIPLVVDTCRFSIKNNLIAIEFVEGESCDTLTYGNGILFYSKVYRNDDNGEYTHIVKPFIDEARRCANKTDSINMIMSTYLNVYVPLNLYK